MRTNSFLQICLFLGLTVYFTKGQVGLGSLPSNVNINNDPSVIGNVTDAANVLNNVALSWL